MLESVDTNTSAHYMDKEEKLVTRDCLLINALERMMGAKINTRRIIHQILKKQMNVGEAML